MGRIVTPITISNVVEPDKEVRCEVLVDTGAAGLVLPSAWKEKLGRLPLSRSVELTTADQRPIKGEICGPIKIQIEGFAPIASEVTFLDIEPSNGRYEPLLGYIVLEQSQIAVDMVGHRLVSVKYVDLSG